MNTLKLNDTLTVLRQMMAAKAEDYSLEAIIEAPEPSECSFSARSEDKDLSNRLNNGL